MCFDRNAGEWHRNVLRRVRCGIRSSPSSPWNLNVWSGSAVARWFLFAAVLFGASNAWAQEDGPPVDEPSDEPEAELNDESPQDGDRLIQSPDSPQRSTPEPEADNAEGDEPPTEPAREPVAPDPRPRRAEPQTLEERNEQLRATSPGAGLSFAAGGALGSCGCGALGFVAGGVISTFVALYLSLLSGFLTVWCCGPTVALGVGGTVLVLGMMLATGVSGLLGSLVGTPGAWLAGSVVGKRRVGLGPLAAAGFGVPLVGWLVSAVLAAAGAAVGVAAAVIGAVAWLMFALQVSTSPNSAGPTGFLIAVLVAGGVSLAAYAASLVILGLAQVVTQFVAAAVTGWVGAVSGRSLAPREGWFHVDLVDVPDGRAKDFGLKRKRPKPKEDEQEPPAEETPETNEGGGQSADEDDKGYDGTEEGEAVPY
jgi:hypothetical protein